MYTTHRQLPDRKCNSEAVSSLQRDKRRSKHGRAQPPHEH